MSIRGAFFLVVFVDLAVPWAAAAPTSIGPVELPKGTATATASPLAIATTVAEPRVELGPSVVYVYDAAGNVVSKQ
ncbi:MAG: hypothetical protein JSR82_12040 [Verrucomicrobia bacterium]|nr:hypothetical protein [Verrucomicrobiota bacterium]